MRSVLEIKSAWTVLTKSSETSIYNPLPSLKRYSFETVFRSVRFVVADRSLSFDSAKDTFYFRENVD